MTDNSGSISPIKGSPIKKRTIVKRKSIVNIQPLHAAARLSELGMDPLKEMVNKIREQELILHAMRMSGKRSIIAESNIYSNISRSLQYLIGVGYLDANQAMLRLDKLKEASKGNEDDAMGIQVFLTNEAGTASVNIMQGNPSDSKVTLDGVTRSDSDGTSAEPNGAQASEAIDSENRLGDSFNSSHIDFIPSPDIHPELAGMHYSDRIDIEAGLAELVLDSGEVIEFEQNGSTQIIEGILSAQRSATAAPGLNGGKVKPNAGANSVTNGVPQIIPHGKPQRESFEIDDDSTDITGD